MRSATSGRSISWRNPRTPNEKTRVGVVVTTELVRRVLSMSD
jgi:hypothetical protein